MSDDNRFQVVLTGDLLGGADPERVTANLARLFKMPEAKARQLLGGGPRVVKKDADEATARKFQVALRQAGAHCELKPVNPPAAAPEPAARPATFEARAPAGGGSNVEPSPVGSAGQDGADLETVGTIRTGGAGFTGAFKVAPVGTDLDPGGRPEPAPAPDVSHLSMAEPGADLETLKRDEPPVAPDISHLSLSDD
ncbi:hypothetical protein [Alloalcanivorax profundimaris]|uniref:hypothetical protein n=1 Tax=Alloalcanivorax profundimaris TaxID=2735259 RepID=UPI0013679FD8|nr:hypothetical protein [Alloalcanivorax profundimaris]MBF1801474.1 hypothetical protein [Alloalcanivorax profundimaris]MBM1145488.1 hypothetical protein [Alcanivorax sp. ZXX171]MCQ6261639.1 hypothetical protein [Alcanivorax sp. MM125-6]